MIASKFRLVAIVTAAMFLSSCGGNDQKTTTEEPAKDTASTTEAPVETVAPSTIVTTPQFMFVAKLKVKNYTRWKASHEGHDSVRLKYGIHKYVLGRGVRDSNMVLVALKADDLDKLKKAYEDNILKRAIERAGESGSLGWVITAVFQDTAKISTDLRSMTTFKVKDWTQWQKGFAEGKQERMDNGITDRVVGNNLRDSNMVIVVTAIMDTAKASAYWSSDMLKTRRKTSGVISKPERFVFRVAHRY